MSLSVKILSIGVGLAALLVVGVFVLSFLCGRLMVTVKGVRRDMEVLKRRVDVLCESLDFDFKE